MSAVCAQAVAKSFVSLYTIFLFICQEDSL